MLSTEQFFSVIHEQINDMVEKKVMLRSQNPMVKVDRKSIELECEHEFFKNLEESLEKSSSVCKTFYDYLMHDNPDLYSVVTEKLNTIKIESVEDILDIGKYKPEEKVINQLQSLGFEFFNKGDFTKAYYYFAYLSIVDAHNPQVWFLKGMAEHNLSKFSEALKSFDTSVMLAPNYIAAHIHRINCLIGSKQLEHAKQAYEIFAQDFDAGKYVGNEFVVKNIINIKEVLGVK